jgi:putative tryptophan/tyrosine transport system substrate-binding protein
MRRRTLIAGPFALGLMAFSIALPRAQTAPSAGSRRVGILFPGTMGEHRLNLMRQGMDAVLSEMRDAVVVDVRSAEGKADRLEAFATEFATGSTKVDVILAVASLALLHARRATATIPIVALDLETDPLASGAAVSLARPGGNVTGIFFDAPEVAGKWLQFLFEIVPSLMRVALLYDEQIDTVQLKAGEDAARRIGLSTFGCRSKTPPG